MSDQALEFIERNKERITSITSYALSLNDNTETEIILKEALVDLIAFAHGLNNSLANTQMLLDEACLHCEELQEIIDKRGV